MAKQLAYENANSACQAALRPYRKKGGLSDYVLICADISPSYVQGITLAAALQGKTVKVMNHFTEDVGELVREQGENPS